MALLKEHRKVSMQAKDRKILEADQMQVMDRSHLLLQNLKYKIQHLQREIQRIEQQESLYSEIELYPVEEFQTVAPSVLIVEDPHALMLNRLSFELDERKRLIQELSMYREKRDEIEKMVKDKMQKLESLHGSIEGVIETARNLQTQF